MATLIPALSTCLSRMTAGEKRLADRLERKLDDDYLLWWDVPIGPKQTHPDFVVLHPHRGALILETKDWHPSTIVQANRDDFIILDSATGGTKTVRNPLVQARHCAIQVITALQQDPQPLAVKLAAHMQAKGLEARVHVRHFHKWVREQLVTYHQLPGYAEGWQVGPKMEEYVRCLMAAVDRRHVPAGQYHAILIDEGHDFAPEWLKLVTQMVDPHTNSLLLLYDDAQSIYRRGKHLRFSLKSVGIQAQRRTTILKINYRNTRQILQLAHQVAGDLLQPQDASEDGIPLLAPMSCGREGPQPIVIDLPTLPERAARIADLLADQHAQGHAWNEMAVLCRDWTAMDLCSHALRRKGLPHRVRRKAGDYRPQENTIHVMTMHASKGLEWPVVAVLSADTEGLSPEDLEMEAKLAYVAATRARAKGLPC